MEVNENAGSEPRAAQPLPAVIEESVPLQALLRLRERGPRGLPGLAHLIDNGDWLTRTMAVSAMGTIIRDDPILRLIHAAADHASRWIPGARALEPLVLRAVRLSVRAVRRALLLKHWYPSAVLFGPLFSWPIAGCLKDRFWAVRTAAALALGECREVSRIRELQSALRDPMCTVRIAAAAALTCMGVTLREASSQLLADAEPAPEHIGSTILTSDVLAHLASAHRAVLSALSRVAGVLCEPMDSMSWAQILAGSPGEKKPHSVKAEIDRYADETETHYFLCKPFTRVNREQNVRLLDAFLVLAERLRAPHEGLVLDLGGGAAWVTELLTRLGYRVITLDIAPTLLRLGRKRLQQAQLPARLVVGDMTALPIAPGSLDAVVIVDALHHVPRIEAVFFEAFRALVPGGQFLIAEPGEGHSESAKSRGEMHEYGVSEGEIHVKEAVKFARAAGFDPIQIVPHHVPMLSLGPEDLEAAALTPMENWNVSLADGLVPFSKFVLESIYSSPVIVFSKGVRPFDSRMPHKLTARIEPRLARDRLRVHGTVRLANTGDTIWLAGGAEPGRVRLGIQLMSPDRRILNRDYARVELPADIGPGTAADLPVQIGLPSESEPYVLKLDMVDEQVCWFEDRDGQPVYVAV
ncbi:MAG: class I SAM-dependent methyltransferase [Acidobacteriota bacterium]